MTLYAVPRRELRPANMALIYQQMAELGGFRAAPDLTSAAFRAVPPTSLRRGWGFSEPAPEADGALERADLTGLDPDARFAALSQRVDALVQRAGIVSTATGFPVRENLEADAKILVPLETPFRNLLARVPGAGLASSWKQATSLGGGWGSGYDQPGGGSTAQIFYKEDGAPAKLNTVYAPLSASYKLLGALGSITRFAMAAGANFMPQYSTEMMHSLLNTMILEEFSLINGDSTATAAPWGDGANALSYDGILNLVTVANGCPSAQVQTAVGPLTTSHIDGQLNRVWKNGGRGLFMLMNIQEAQSLTVLLEASGSLIRANVQAAGPEAGHVVGGIYVTKYNHPATGEQVDILRSRFVPAGTIIYGSRNLPKGDPAIDIDVLPQVELAVPQNAGVQQIQGYAASPLYPTETAPDLLPWIVSLYSVLRLKAATVFAKSTGVTAVS